MSSARPDDFNEYGAMYPTTSPAKRAYAVERIASRQIIDERLIRDAIEARSLLLHEFGRLRSSVERFAREKACGLVGPIRITVEIHAEGQAISDAAGLDESQRDSVYESGLRQVVIDVSR